MRRCLLCSIVISLSVGFAAAQQAPDTPPGSTQSEAEARRMIAEHPDSAGAWFALGYALFKAQKAQPSLDAYTKGASLQTPSANDLLVVGCDYVLLGAYPEADKWFTKAVEWEPRNAGALYYLGRVKYNENRFEEAIDAFSRCLKLEPRNVKAEDNLGLSLEGLSRTEEAMAAFKTAIAWQADASHQEAGPYLDLGIVLTDHDHPGDALPFLQTAVRLAPQDVRTHRALGKAYLHLNRAEDARKALEQAVAVGPSDASAHFLLAQAYRKLGLMDKAHAESERFQQLSH